jgi:PiT family inorganic phosphate transporter
VAAKAAIPVWVMMIGALGIAVGLALYGSNPIRNVGSEITERDQMRAFCIAMAAAITVIIATQLGLPVSWTHIAAGAVFGVGSLREYLKSTHARMIAEIEEHHQGADRMVVEAYLESFRRASLQQKGIMLRELKENQPQAPQLAKKERKGVKKVYRKELVKRSALMKIAAAWVITVPFSGLLAAILFFTIRGMMLP